MEILVYGIMVLLIVYWLLCFVLYACRNKIFEHFNNSFGYLSSFLFSSFMLTPVLCGVIPALYTEEARIAAPFTIIYCIPALIWYFKKSKKVKKIGLFWAMLGIGMYVPLFLIFDYIVKDIKFSLMHGGSSNSGDIKTVDNGNIRITDKTGKTTGYYYEGSGRITNSTGNTAGYYDKESGRVTDETGNTTGYIRKDQF